MPESKVVVYNKLEEELRMQIKSGFLQDRTRLRSENAFAARYGISRSSVRKALATLEKEGLIRRSRGCGTLLPGKIYSGLRNGKHSRGKTYFIFPFPLFTHEMYFPNPVLFMLFTTDSEKSCREPDMNFRQLM